MLFFFVSFHLMWHQPELFPLELIFNVWPARNPVKSLNMSECCAHFVIWFLTAAWLFPLFPVIMETERGTGHHEMPGCLHPRLVASCLGQSTWNTSSLSSCCRMIRSYLLFNLLVLYLFLPPPPAVGSSCLSTCPMLESSMNEGSLDWPHTPLSTECLLVNTHSHQLQPKRWLIVCLVWPFKLRFSDLTPEAPPPWMITDMFYLNYPWIKVSSCWKCSSKLMNEIKRCISDAVSSCS